MEEWMKLSFILVGTFELISIAFYYIFFSRFKFKTFRYFPFVQMCLLVYVVMSYFVFRSYSSGSIILREWLIRSVFLIYGVFIILRYKFFHDVIDMSGKKTKNRVMGILSILYLIIPLTPFFADFKRNMPGVGYYINTAINSGMMIYFFVNIVMYINKPENKMMRPLLRGWAGLVVLYLPYSVVQDLSPRMNYFRGKISSGEGVPPMSFVLAGIIFIILVNIIYYYILRINLLINPVLLESEKTKSHIPVLEQGMIEAMLKDKGITGREREIVALIISGASNKEIGDKLFISETTVKSHVSHIYRKMDVKRRVELVNAIIQLS